jgi:hypothetical protein
MFKLREYQQEAANKGKIILNEFGILILNFEVRTGKTHIALNIGANYESVLFVTKKKAISSIEKDYNTANHSYKIQVINYESLHKVKGEFDLIICDESHCLGAYPKPSKRVKQLKEIVKYNHLILMTGTLLPESNSQIFHQLHISKLSPFNDYYNFYKWFALFGKKGVKYTAYGQCADYSNTPYENIKEYIDKIKLSFTQNQAGFKSVVNEHIRIVNISRFAHDLAHKLKRDNVIQGRNHVILADTGVKLMSKLHQIYSGTIKFECGVSEVIDKSKAEYIRDNFKGKIAIFYKFKAELDAIKSVLDVTQDLEEFNNSGKSIALQIVSGREGVNLSKAECIVYYNIDFSAVSYWQSRDRLTTMDRLENNVYWLFSDGGIEADIYKTVLDKKNFTLQTFKKHERERGQNSKSNNR